MRQADFKRFRVVLSLLLLLPASAVFLDLTHLVPSAWITGALAFQVLPALTRSLHLIGFSTVGLAVVLILTLLFGRVYCSTLCPLGTLQDVISYVARKSRRRRWYRPLPTHAVLRFTILVLTLGSLASGMMALATLLDPFSNYGRILAGLIRPLAVGANNGTALLLERVGVFFLYPLNPGDIGWISLGAPLLALGIVGRLAWSRGRLFCNSICPAGALLSLFARRPFWRITIHGEECTGCGLCERVCKAGCIDPDSKSVDMSRCVACFNCLPECPTQGITYARVPLRRESPAAPDSIRRDILAGAIVYLGGLAGLTPAATRTIIAAKNSTVPVTRTLPVTPPGAGSIPRLTGRCTACHACISACPTQVLVPSFLDYGLPGILQPQMDYRRSFCNFECTRCTDVCPSGALLPLAPAEKKTTRLGTATFVKENCIVYTEGTECGACSEHCPTKAVQMVPYKALQAPAVREDFCIGCGACEFACPTRPYKAIYVEGLREHGRAKLAPREKVPDSAGEGFPF